MLCDELRRGGLLSVSGVSRSRCDGRVPNPARREVESRERFLPGCETAVEEAVDGRDEAVGIAPCICKISVQYQFLVPVSRGFETDLLAYTESGSWHMVYPKGR